MRNDKKTLVVIGGVWIDERNKQTVDLSYNTILNAYSRIFDKILYIGPSSDNNKKFRSKTDNVFMVGIKSRSSFVGQLTSIFKFFSHKRIIQNEINSFHPDIIQLRIPSLFTFLHFLSIKNSNVLFTTYIGGDWYDSHVLNHKYFGAKFVAYILNFYNKSIISKSIPVTAGPVLAKKYELITECYAYRSTTHNHAYRRTRTKKPNRLLIVGRLEPLKRVKDAILTLNNLIKKDNSYTLNIVGEGKLQVDLHNLVEQLGIQNNIKFSGYASDKSEMEKHYLNADILLHPSSTEGTSKVLAEAMSYGVIPIAVEGVGSNNYIIDNGINGYLVPLGDTNMFINSILNFVDDIDKYQSLLDGVYAYAHKHTINNEISKMWKYVFSKNRN